MTLFRICFVLLISTGFTHPGSVAAAEPVPTEPALDSTALVTSPKNGRILGLAFCIDTSGYFITNHFATKEAVDGHLTVVLKPGGGHERSLPAKIIRADLKVGLALLKSDIPVDRALVFSDEVHLEGRTVKTVGFAEEASASGLPALGMSRTRMTLPDWSGRFDAVQTEPPRHSGHSGAPVIDDSGRVVGVVASAGLKFFQVTPVSQILGFLKEPVLRAEFPKTASWSDRHKPMRLRVAVDLFSVATPPDDLMLTLDDGYSKRVVHAEKSGADFLFEGPLHPKRDPCMVKLDLILPDSVSTCFAEDTFLHGTDGTFLLSELDGYESGRGLLTRDGTTHPLQETNDMLTVYLAQNPIQITLREVDAFQVEPMAESSFVRYQITARTSGLVTATLDGRIDLNDAPHRTGTGRNARIVSPLTLQPHKPFAGEIQVQLPAPVTDVTLAGNGRYMFLRLDKVQQLALFDVVALRVVKFIPLTDPNALVAGGASTFVIAVPDQKRMQRWDLETLEPGPTRTWVSELMNIAMGYGSEGPVMIRTKKYPGWITFTDLHTFQSIRRLQDRITRPSESMDFRVSADGLTIGAQHLDEYKSNLDVFSISEVKTTHRSRNSAKGYAAPGPGGEYIYTEYGVLAPNAILISTSTINFMTFPTTLPAYFLGSESVSEKDKATPMRLRLFEAGSPKPIAMLPETPEVDVTHRTRLNERMTVDKRIHFVPQARILVTISTVGNSVVARYVDLEAILKEAGRDYFYVNSLPVKRIEPGGRYRYPVRVKSKVPKFRYTLISGPEGMKADEKGLLSWDVPQDFSGNTQVIVNLQRGDGRELYHAFKIEVVPPIAPAEETVTKEEERKAQ